MLTAPPTDCGSVDRWRWRMPSRNPTSMGEPGSRGRWPHLSSSSGQAIAHSRAWAIATRAALRGACVGSDENADQQRSSSSMQRRIALLSLRSTTSRISFGDGVPSPGRPARGLAACCTTVVQSGQLHDADCSILPRTPLAKASRATHCAGNRMPLEARFGAARRRLAGLITFWSGAKSRFEAGETAVADGGAGRETAGPAGWKGRRRKPPLPAARSAALRVLDAQHAASFGHFSRNRRDVGRLPILERRRQIGGMQYSAVLRFAPGASVVSITAPLVRAR